MHVTQNRQSLLDNTVNTAVRAWRLIVDQCLPAASFFFGARIWLRMTFNYPVLWVRVKGQPYHMPTRGRISTGPGSGHSTPSRVTARTFHAARTRILPGRRPTQNERHTSAASMQIKLAGSLPSPSHCQKETMPR